MKRKFFLKIIIWLTLTLLSTTSGFSAPSPNPEMAAAEALLQNPNLDLSQAEKALDLYQGVLYFHSAPRPIVLAHLARTCFILGDLASKDRRNDNYRKGKAYAQLLIDEYPNLTQGYYWMALNLCGEADATGYMTGRRLLPQILEQLKRALALSETYDQAGAHRVLGRIYFEAPAWPMSVGDLQKSLHHLKAAVKLAPNNSTNHLYLAETLGRLRYLSLAREQLEMVLKCNEHAVKPQDIEEDRRDARRMLADFSGNFGDRDRP